MKFNINYYIYELDFVNDFSKSNMYISAYNKSIKLAEKRGVPEDRILRTKEEADKYFTRRK